MVRGGRRPSPPTRQPKKTKGRAEKTTGKLDRGRRPRARNRRTPNTSAAAMNESPPAGGEASGSARPAKDIYTYNDDLVVVSKGTFAARDRVLCPVGAGCLCSDPEGNRPRGAGPAGVRRDELESHVAIKHPGCELVGVPPEGVAV